MTDATKQTIARLGEMRRRCLAATKGPWKISGNGKQLFASDGMVADFDIQLCDDDDRRGAKRDDIRNRKNVEIAAHARTDLPAALDLIDELLEVIRECHMDATMTSTRVPRKWIQDRTRPYVEALKETKP